MSTIIQVIGSDLHLPGSTIVDCWEDEQCGLLSRAAGLALMPLLNEERRAYTAWQRAFDEAEARGDAQPPELPEKRYLYRVDGEDAIPSFEVEEDEFAIVYDGDGARTGRIFLQRLSDILG